MPSFRADDMPVAYVAGPYRAHSAWGIEQNIRRAEELALEVWKMGFATICPHANTRFYQGETDDELWLQGDLAILSRCDVLVLTPDWERSSGAREEVAWAVEKGITVVTTLRELHEFLVGWNLTES